MQEIILDEGLQCLVIVASYYGIAADAETLAHNLALAGRESTPNDLIKGAKWLKIKAKKTTIHAERLAGITLPAILQIGEGRYILAVKADEEKVLTMGPDDKLPKLMTYLQLSQIWGGEIILLTPRVQNQQHVEFGLKWFLPTIIKYKVPLLEVLLAAFIMQILALFSPLITQSIIDKVLVHNSLSTLDVLGIALVVITLFEMVLSIGRNYVFTHTTSKIDVILSSRMFEHLFHLPLMYFESRRVGDTVARARELENIRRFLTGVPMTTLLDTMFIIVYVMVMLLYSVPLTLISVASLPILAVISAIITPVLKERLDEKFSCGAESQSYLVESVNGVQTIKSFALEPIMQKKWERLVANGTKAGFKTSILSGNTGAFAQFVQKVFDISILWFGAKFVIEGELTVGGLVAFRMLSGRVSGPVLRLVQMWQEFQQTSLSIRRLGDIFNSRPEPTIEGTQTKLPSLHGDIRFERVTFRYRMDTAEVIKNMTFSIPPGIVIGIVGRSGCGKSTISKLIQRLYIPESGKILIDGMDISLANPSQIRKQIGVVLQESFLFNATVRENIAVQNPAASIEEIIKVAQIAGAHEFISELPEGYDTLIGEKGTGLSGGQKQRLAIARALITNPKILIFDEATSALDYESEMIIQNNLKEICKDRTVLLIAHRLSTLRDADAIMVVDHGSIIEYGSQKMLLSKKGAYYQMLARQNLQA